MEENKKKILLIDDEEETIYFLSNFLQRQNYEVVEATSGHKGLELAKKIKPDLIILDIVMPDMDGGDVAMALEKDPATSEIPIIFLTAIMRKKEEPHIEKTGRHYIVAKPIDEDGFLSVVRKTLSG